MPTAWSYWAYDSSGKLTEFRRGRGAKIENHDTNFKRDEQGRLTGYEYRQGAKDELFSRTQIHYSNDGKTVEVTQFDATGAILESTTQTEGEHGHVVEAIIRDRDWRTKQMKPPLTVFFRYDERGRLIEQNTEVRAIDKTAGEQGLPPGKVSIVYDDLKNTRTTRYSGTEGSLVLVVTRNTSGATVAFTVRTHSAPLDSVIHCTYDTYGNWTTCRQDLQAGEPLSTNAVKMWRRTITYR